MHILPRLIIILFFILSSGCNIYKPVDARKVSPVGSERAKKNIEEGRGISFGGPKTQGGVFDFASSNEMWRASIEVLDFVSFTNASYSGGIIITDWFSGNKDSQEENLRELKITVRFLSNEIRADGLKVIVHEKLCSSIDKSDCQIQKIESEINQLELEKTQLEQFLQDSELDYDTILDKSNKLEKLGNLDQLYKLDKSGKSNRSKKLDK